jgi:predicted ester cyclase
MKGQQAVASADTRKAAFRQALEIWQEGRADRVDAVVTANYVGHTSTGDRNIDGLRKRIVEFHALYPDIRFTVEDQLAEGDRVTTRMTAIGTSQATGKPVRLIGVNISRFVGNRIAEEWPVWEVVR